MRVLVADDDRLFQVLLGKALKSWGYQPQVVDDGEKAWNALNSRGAPPLAILDWVMPEADGLEVCRRIRSARLPHYTYIVLMTSKSEPADLVAGLEAGADDYVPKPVNLSLLRLRLRAARRVLEAEARHRMIAEMASDGIVTMDHNGTILLANTAAASIFDRETDDVVGRQFSDLIPGFERTEQANAEFTLPNGSTRVRCWPAVELIAPSRTGRDVPVEVSFAESIDGSNECVQAAMIRDIRERRARDTQRAQAQKLESIGQLAAGVAHEINTPIQYIGDNLHFIHDSFRSLTELLVGYERAFDHTDRRIAEAGSSDPHALSETLDRDYLVEETPRAIEQALDGVSRVTEIVRAMKAFSHPGSLEMAPSDLNQMIENTALVAKNRWKYVADLELRLDRDIPPVVCMAGELNQVFLNLIVNAADAIGDVIKNQSGAKGMLRVSTSRDGGFVKICVSDTGTGIPATAQAKLFDPFFTTKPVGSGTGQGLSIAYAIVVQKHRGTITFETELGVGTTFIVRLPIERDVQGSHDRSI
jgi:two-component system NtrC family sensor kinase